MEMSYFSVAAFVIEWDLTADGRERESAAGRQSIRIYLTQLWTKLVFLTSED